MELKIRHIVNEAEGKVIAMFDMDAMGNPIVPGVLDEVSKKGRNETVTSMAGMLDENIAYLSIDFAGLRGVATCLPEDTFDIRKGKDIATGKLMAKYHKRMKKSYQLALRELRKVENDLMAFEQSHYNKERKIREDLERIPDIE